jgi:hypothetical protein
VAVGLFFATAIAPTVLQDIAPNIFSSRVIALYPLVLMVPRAIVPSLVGALSDWGGQTPTSLSYAICLVSGATLPVGIALLFWIQPAFGKLSRQTHSVNTT